MADRILEHFRATELQRVNLEQQLIDSRVAATEAQIDPRRLFDDLARIRSEFAADSTEAEDSLNSLIHSLRAALARTKRVEELEAPRK
jgi:sensor histidine kinase YesM